jgi:hypothetical protein
MGQNSSDPHMINPNYNGQRPAKNNSMDYIKLSIESFNPYLKAKDSHFTFSYAFKSEKAFAKMMRALRWKFAANYHIVRRGNVQFETYAPIDCR